MTTPWPERIEVRPLTASDAARIAAWQYEGPWRVYDLEGTDLTTQDGNFAVAGAEGGPLVGFCCRGVEARVPGLAADPGLLDIGVGMDPDQVGHGNGAAFGRAVLAFMRAGANGRRLRAVVATWNTRSLRLARTLGFTRIGTHHCVRDGKDVEYAVLVTADPSGDV